MKTFILAIAALLTTFALRAQDDEYKPAQMSSFLKVSPPIVEKLKSRVYFYSKSQELVRDFNAWYNSR